MINKKFKMYFNTTIPADKNIKCFLDKNNLSELKPWLDKYPFVELIYEIPNGHLEISLELNQIITMTKELGIQQLITNSYVIGNDAGDTIYLYIKNEKLNGIYKIDDDLSIDSLSFIAKNLSEWLN